MTIYTRIILLELVFLFTLLVQSDTQQCYININTISITNDWYG